MALYLVEHHHTEEMCPRKNPEVVRQLSNYITAENAEKFGIKMLADGVNEAEHTVLLILEADSPEQVTSFASPFLEVGSLSVKVGATCQEVAEQCAV